MCLLKVSGSAASSRAMKASAILRLSARIGTGFLIVLGLFLGSKTPHDFSLAVTIRRSLEMEVSLRQQDVGTQVIGLCLRLLVRAGTEGVIVMLPGTRYPGELKHDFGIRGLKLVSFVECLLSLVYLVRFHIEPAKERESIVVRRLLLQIVFEELYRHILATCHGVGAAPGAGRVRAATG